MKKILGGLVISALLAAPAVALTCACRSRPRRRRSSPCSAGPAATSAVTSATPGARRDIAAGFDAFNFSYDHDIDGFIAGGQVGCNLWQSDRWVFGIEGQASWADHRRSALVRPHVNCRSPQRLQDRCGHHRQHRGPARLRFRRDRSDAGVRERRRGLHPRAVLREPGRRCQLLFTTDKELRWGWMVGGGFEQALNSNWSLKAEYNYSNFGSDDFRVCTIGCDLRRFRRQAARPPGQGRHQLPLRRRPGCCALLIG